MACIDQRNFWCQHPTIQFGLVKPHSVPFDCHCHGWYKKCCGENKLYLSGMHCCWLHMGDCCCVNVKFILDLLKDNPPRRKLNKFCFIEIYTYIYISFAFQFYIIYPRRSVIVLMGKTVYWFYTAPVTLNVDKLPRSCTNCFEFVPILS